MRFPAGRYAPASAGGGRTHGLIALTGKQVWTFRDGKYGPVVADATHVYLVGYTRASGAVPK